MSDEPIVITGEDNIEHTRWLAVRSALKLEIMGLTRRGRSAMTLANEITGNRTKRRKEAYVALNAKIVAELGEWADKPYNAAWEHKHG